MECKRIISKSIHKRIAFYDLYEFPEIFLDSSYTTREN